MKTFTHFRRSCALGTICELISYAFILLCGYGISNLLKVVMAGSGETLWKLAGFTVGILVFALIPKYLLIVLRSRTRLKDIQSFREFLYKCVLNRQVQAADRGEMSVRMNSDTKTIAGYYQETVPKAVSGMLVMLCSAFLLMASDWRIGGIFFLMNLTQLIPIVVYEKWTRQIYNQTHSDEEDYCAWMLEGYDGIETIKSYGVERWFMERYWKLNRAIVNSGKRAEQVGTVERVIFSAIDSLLNYGSYLIIGCFVLKGSLPMEKTPILVILSGYLFSSISSVFDLRLQQFQYQEAVARLGCWEHSDFRGNAEVLLTVSGLSKSFYGRCVLNDVSCTVRKGEKLLLSGDNGSGKSTLLRLVLGLEEADSGTVRWGIPENARAVSLQEEPELSATGEELIQAMDTRIDRNSMEQHFKVFQIAELLAKPLNQLSPGERKKFYLSAALAHQGEILILDEPTNHLDREAVDYLNRVLRESGKTMIVCSHGNALDVPFTREIHMEGGCCHETV